MRRGMLGRKGVGGSAGSASNKEHNPQSLSKHVLFSQQGSGVGRRKCPSNYSRPRGTWPDGPSTPRPLHPPPPVPKHAGMLVASLGWLLYGFSFSCSMSSAEWLAECRVRSITSSVSSLCSPEGLEVIEVCITAVLPLIEQRPHVGRYGMSCHIRNSLKWLGPLNC